MLMDELFDRLRQFQELLMERVSIEKQLKELPKSILAQEEVLIRIKKTHVDKKTRFDEVSTKLGILKFELEEVVQLKAHSEKQMDNISSPREFEALNKEITEAGYKEDKLRKEIKTNEEVLKDADSDLKSTSALISSQEAEITEKQHKIMTEETTMTKRIEELKITEQKVTTNIDSEIIFKFERIINSKQSLGIVPVKGAVCSGCSMILPAQFVNEVRQGNRVIFCPYCSRVLYYQDSDTAEAELFIDIESGSLADLDDFGDDSEDDSYDEEESSGKNSMDETDN
ncbi:MAG: hypothetical protein A2087_00610 [Spirochaetes bacterium GWD1_61_31]|nr:MAG: hypothetical protein A2Y37_03030 [Spirochaetes bacterium GWB1_60_80]OHD29589.1 MAG: hypothetical protein A2004_01565 [Spirochaetes bacterium GWC1_61_12]OHD37494.1 MAG: hypothetical protein A2087_00610 [Spirochaetes bacterium GWD1_61_31]OHD41997.1 MAG: hypothetical protein A2Y35_14660 [Spirochaetes bacterium GWE1_60_18]OHD61736.1 MAG: hypothetical protein A2Y32_13285 [Spirochaetes bacterium GWF1_60_12]